MLQESLDGGCMPREVCCSRSHNMEDVCRLLCPVICLEKSGAPGVTRWWMYA